MRADFENLYVQAMRDINSMRDHNAELKNALREAHYYVRIAWGSDRAAELSARIARLLDVADGEGTVTYSAEERANADRIVACVNALEGLNPEFVRALVSAVSELVSLAYNEDGEYLGLDAEEFSLLRLALSEAYHG